MAFRRVNVSLPVEVYERMEVARGDVSRSKFMLRALESALSSGSGARAEAPGVSAPPPSGAASSRAPKSPSIAQTWRR